MSFILTSLPGILYLPFFILGAFGLFFFLFTIKTKNPLEQCFFFSFLFMGLWRYYYGDRMNSSRYGALMIYPALFFSVYTLYVLCFSFFPYICQPFLQKKHITIISVPLRKTMCGVVFLSFVLVLNSIEFHKFFKINLQRNYTQFVAEAYNKSKTPEDMLYSGREADRVKYYTKSPEVFMIDNERTTADEDFLKQNISLLKNVIGDHYFFSFQKPDSYFPDLTQTDNGILTQKASFFTSKQKKLKFVLYSFHPRCPNIQEKQKASYTKNNNLASNGDFELPRNESQLVPIRKQLKLLNLENYIETNTLPAAWSLGLIEANKSNPPIITLTKNNPIEGKQSLLLDSSHTPFDAVTSSSSIIVQDCTFSLFVRGEGNAISDLTVEIRSYVPSLQKGLAIQTLFFKIQPRKLYRINGIINKGDFPLSNDFCLTLSCNGIISVDAISIMPISL